MESEDNKEKQKKNNKTTNMNTKQQKHNEEQLEPVKSYDKVRKTTRTQKEKYK